MGVAVRRRRVTAGLAAIALAAALAACGGTDAPVATSERPRPPVATTDRAPAPTAPIESEPPGVEPEGFTTVTARITAPDGEVCEVCVWLADSADERGRGLMGVTDLGDAAGMAFVFESPTSGSFYMFRTPTPLTIAWFAPDGSLVGTADMDPCIDTPASECPLYSPGAEYDLAIEVFAGGLDALLVGPGSTAVLVDGSESDHCLVAPGTG